MLLMNQDHNIVIVLEDLQDQALFIKANVDEETGKTFEVNLYLDNILLGCYDTGEKALIELHSIGAALNEDQERYIVGGFCQLTDEEQEAIDMLQETLDTDEIFRESFEENF